MQRSKVTLSWKGSYPTMGKGLPYHGWKVLAGGSNHGEDPSDEKVSLFDSGRRGGGLRLHSVLRAPQQYTKALSSQAVVVAEPQL